MRTILYRLLRNTFLLAIVINGLVSQPAYSQDTIVERSGEKIQARVLEIGPENITYKKFTNLSGPSYVILKTDVKRIIYENGSEDVFESTAKPVAKESLSSTKPEALSSSPLKAKEFKPYFSSGFNILMHQGIFGSTVPARPDGGSLNPNGGDSYLQYGFGVDLDYHFMSHLGLHFDINAYTNTTPVAFKGGYASSFWVFEMTDYSNNLIGPFSEDVNYTISTTGMRLGLKAYIFKDSRIQPWYGLYYGYYAWTIGIYSKDKKSTYGNTSGSTSSLMIYNLGIDFWTKDKSMGATLFAEFGSPVARNYQIDDCLKNGWTFQDYGEGTHLFGYNRIGLSLNFALTKKK